MSPIYHDAVFASQEFDRMVAIAVEALLAGATVEIPHYQLCKIGHAWARHSREPSQLIAERAAASEYCAAVQDRLRDLGVDGDVFDHFMVFSSVVDRLFPERLLH